MASGKGRLEGKVAIVTGGGTGLGKATCLTLADEGADIVVAARRVELIEQTAKEVRAKGRKSIAIPTDVTVSEQANRLIDRTISEMGKLDILVNNAGIVRGEKLKPIWEITDAEWRLGIDTNLSGSFYCSRAATKYFFEQKHGKIINFSSGAGLRGRRDRYMYECAKAGILGLTRSLAITYGPSNIQTNCVMPGAHDTSELQANPADNRGQGRVTSRVADYIPMGHFGSPFGIGALVLFLASDASDYINGEVFMHDGGAFLAFGPTGLAPVMPLKEV